MVVHVPLERFRQLLHPLDCFVRDVCVYFWLRLWIFRRNWMPWVRRRTDLRTVLVYWERNLDPVLSLSNASRNVLFTDRNVLLARTASMLVSLLETNDHLSNSRAMSVHTTVSFIHRRACDHSPLQQLE